MEVYKYYMYGYIRVSNAMREVEPFSQTLCVQFASTLINFVSSYGIRAF